MKRIGDRSFMFAWQAIRAATQPNPEATAWQVGDVRWQRHRHSHAAPDHAMTIEVYRLDSVGGPDQWSVMVVSEHWWDERHVPLRNHLWATHLAGSRARVEEWIMRESRRFDRTPPLSAESGG